MRASRLSLVLAVLVTGCSASDDDAGVELSPLQPYYQVLSRTRDVVGDHSGAPNRTYEEIVASCMAESGFEYWLEGGQVPVEQSDEATSPSQIERVKQEGYGIIPPYEELDRTLIKENELGANQRYLSSLSEVAYDEYIEALYGVIWNDISAAAEVGLEIPWDWRKGGCDGVATHELESREVGIAFAAGPFDTLLEGMESLTLQVPSTEKWRESVEKWSSCMADSGFEYSTPEVAFSSIEERYATLLSAVVLPGTRDGGPVVVGEATSSLPSREAYDALRDLERRVAVADALCHQEVELDRVYAEILLELEVEFVDLHKEELDAMALWAEH